MDKNDEIVVTTPVAETTQYEGFMEVLDEEYKESSDDPADELKDMFGVSEDKEWKKYWKGMPEFENEDNPPFKKIIVSFRTKEDYEDFAKLIGQKMTDKTKSIWHPRLNVEENRLLRWIVED